MILTRLMVPEARSSLGGGKWAPEPWWGFREVILLLGRGDIMAE